MERLTRTATNRDRALTALAFVIIAASAAEQWAALSLGFIPARLSGADDRLGRAAGAS